ncbi:MAG: GIY-YIG nuclease family protein [Patescibacteria group bacterium]
MNENFSYVYIMASKSGVIYVGSTIDLEGRVYQHKHHLLGEFTKKYHCERLVYYEEYEELSDAREREIQLKKWRREKKEKLINSLNPSWSDLSSNWFHDQIHA